MNFNTKHKILIENLFADMVVLTGTYMEYISNNSEFNSKSFIEYFYQKSGKVKERCRLQRYVIGQAKKYFIKIRSPKNITYNRVKRVFRINIKCSYRIRVEQYYFWKYVMDYILNNKMLFSIMLKEVLKECPLYTSDVDAQLPYANCLYRILERYYVRISENNRIYGGKDRKTINLLFESYEQFSMFQKNCRAYIRENNMERDEKKHEVL